MISEIPDRLNSFNSVPEIWSSNIVVNRLVEV